MAEATTRVDFYVLAASAAAQGAASAKAVDKYLLACRIASKAYSKGLTVYMQTEEATQNETLDKMLWTFSQSSFVPHTIWQGDGDGGGDRGSSGEGGEHDIARYPVQIGCCAAPSKCQDVLISLCRSVDAYAEQLARFARVAELVAGDAEEKAAARDRYRFYQAQGITPETHKI